ncbi:MAG: hypothetical protein LKF96_08260 [Treponema sp.]|jgi:hypothetical protein|nr:hypothetical protein [Treponema sp.]
MELVDTCKIENVAKKPGIETLHASENSEINSEENQMVKAVRSAEESGSCFSEQTAGRLCESKLIK